MNATGLNDVEVDAMKRRHFEVLHLQEIPTSCGTCRLFARLTAAEAFREAVLKAPDFEKYATVSIRIADDNWCKAAGRRPDSAI